jgi:long-chain acyl-CoA synthetase
MAFVDSRIRLAFEDREYTRADIDAMAGGLAAGLRELGVNRGDRVALMSTNRPEFVACLQAIWGIGASVVLLSPAWKQTEVRHALGLTQATKAIGDCAVLADELPMLSLDEPISMLDNEFDRPHPDSDALFVFSSGTTGLPKAVRHTHGSFAAARAHWQTVLELTSADRIQILTPPSHILGLLNIETAMENDVWMRLHRRFDVDVMLRTIDRDRITIEMAVAPIALAMAAHPTLELYDLSSLRYMVWGATPFAPSVAETVSRRGGVRWVTAYGASEVPVIACNPLHAPRLDTVGPAVPGVEVRIVAADTGEIVSTGEAGELQVRSDSMMAGYLPEDASTEAFTSGWYRTGDVGTVDADGYLRITDRLKEMIKVRGFQVAPAEIEAVLHRHPSVADCAAFGVPDAVDGEAIVIAVEARADVEAAELISFVRERLASYKQPRVVQFVAQIPRSASGKVLRRMLKEVYEPPPETIT